jgi:hypothetical protein
MANSIYDGEFLNNFKSYRNKQRLVGGQIDPRVVGSLAEADLNSRYADQRSRRSLDLQEKSINNRYELGQTGLAQSAAMNNRILDAQKKSAGISNMGSIANILLQGGALDNKMGLWGGDTATPSSYPSSTPSLYNSASGNEFGTDGDWFSGPDTYDTPNMDSYASSQGPSDDEWLYNTFKDYFDSF